MKDNPTVGKWLEKLPPDLQNITRELIAVARKNMPGVHEFIYHDAVGYSVNDSPSDRICYIAPQKKDMSISGFYSARDFLTRKSYWLVRENDCDMSKSGAWTKRRIQR